MGTQDLIQKQEGYRESSTGFGQLGVLLKRSSTHLLRQTGKQKDYRERWTESGRKVASPRPCGIRLAVLEQGRPRLQIEKVRHYKDPSTAFEGRVGCDEPS